MRDSAHESLDDLPVRRLRGASEQVAGEIQHFINARSLQPGDRLGTEGELARLFGVSRPTLREALRLLASRNLLRAVKGPGGGIFVARTPESGMGRSVSETIAMMLELNSISIEELLEARMLLEPSLVRLCADRATDETLSALRDSIARAEASVGDATARRRSNEGFHRTIAEAAGNRIVQAVTEWVFDVLQPRLKEVMAPIVSEPAIAEQHRAILRAIEKRDAAEAEAAMREHLRHLLDRVRANQLVDAGRRSSG